jgi:Xaa-Pro aminopeptidase/Xaa-Pro dipeptidase
MFRGYAVDLTRTITLGPATARQRRLLDDIAAAQDAGFAMVRQGVPATDIDRATRESMAAAGLGEFFGHGTGHGLGLEVHERPRIAQFRAQLPGEPLQPGMVFTIEPGAYFPGPRRAHRGRRGADNVGSRVAHRCAAVDVSD